MTATEEFVRESFSRFNREIFSGKLPPVKVALSRSRSFVGKLQYHRDYTLKISTLFDLPQSELEDVVIHEMIHLLILSRNIPDRSSHGPAFRKIMASVNERYGRHITVSHKGVPAEMPRRTHCVCICKLGEVAMRKRSGAQVSTDGMVGLAVCSEAMAGRIDAQLPVHFRISDRRWYVTRHPFFDKFPHLRSPKLYLVKREDLPDDFRQIF